MFERRNHHRARWLLMLVSLLFAGMARAEPPVSADDLLALADRPWLVFSEAAVQARATVFEDGQTSTVAKLDIFRRGGTHALIVFRDGLQAGRKVLIAEQNVWLLVPGSERPVPITANQRLVGGAAMSDVAPLRFAGNFTATLAAAPEFVNGLECDVLSLRAKKATAAYGSGTLWIDRQRRLARRALLNLPSGKAAREVFFNDYRDDETGKPIIAVMTVRDLLTTAKDLTTRFEFLSYEGARFDDDFFTPAAALKFGEPASGFKDR